MEPEETLGRLLGSIESQVGVLADVSTVVFGDGGMRLSDGFISKHPGVTYEYRTHSGVSATRNALLDASDAEYVMFLDADDVFFSMLGLHAITRAMPNGFDVFASDFVEETQNGYALRKNDQYLLHGKCFRRGYLEDNHIRWDERLITSGDNYFLWQAISLTDRIAYCGTPFYMWCWNKNSVCRSEDGHFVRSYPLAVTSYRLLVENFLSRGRIDLARRFMAMMVYDAWFMTHTVGWEALSGEPCVKESLRLLVEAHREHGDMMHDMPPAEKDAAYRDRQCSYRWDGPRGGMEGAENWIASLR